MKIFMAELLIISRTQSWFLHGISILFVCYTSMYKRKQICKISFSLHGSAVECDGHRSCLWKLLGDASSLVFNIHESNVRFVCK